MSKVRDLTVDGNEAVAQVAHLTSDILAIYPITPASTMGEWADTYSALKQTNLWGTIPTIVEMQSEAGAAGTLHGAIQAGAIGSTFTSSQGLLLMIPSLYKIVGELTPCVIHVAARSIATHALSIFCDHSDVMACRGTGAGFWFSNSVQEAHDGALISQMISLRSRLPFLHVFDGFRTSHEVTKIHALSSKQIHQLFPWSFAEDHRSRAMTPNTPTIRGTSQNPDVFFQSRERSNSVYAEAETVVLNVLEDFHQTTGRRYQPYEYVGAVDAENVLILMGSSVETVKETVTSLNEQGEKVGVIAVHLYRPFVSSLFASVLPETTKHIAVLDRTKEPGSVAEPLFLDVCAALDRCQRPELIRSHGRYGLSSKEFTPAMVKGIFDAMQGNPLSGFTIGIEDDLNGLSLPFDANYRNTAHDHQFQAVFYGLGADGTVSANKNTIKIIGEQTERFAQGYFEYDSKKSGAVTVSHLRFSDQPIQSTYLIQPNTADFIACHQFNLLERYSVLDRAKQGATFLINAPYSADDVWDQIPPLVQQAIIDKGCSVYVIDAVQLAKELGLGKRINTIMQSCFFAISHILPVDTAVDLMKKFVTKTYKKAGKPIIEANHQAIMLAVSRLQKVEPKTLGTVVKPVAALADTDDFIQRVIIPAMKGHGDLIAVSHLPIDGVYPTNTAKLEKRNISERIPAWETDLCTQCGKCVFVCPHSVLRSKLIAQNGTHRAPDTFKQTALRSKAYGDGWDICYQVSPEDCTGCELCVDVCPIVDKTDPNRKAINMVDKGPLLEAEKINWQHYLTLPEVDHAKLRTTTIPGSSLCEPLFEFSGACSGCGETPYINLITRLFGDRMLIGNATGCSSIYGGNLPTTPYAKNQQGHGPTWNNSLFEDGAEFTLGLRLSVDQLTQYATNLLTGLSAELPDELIAALLSNEQTSDALIQQQRTSVHELNELLNKSSTESAQTLRKLSDYLIAKSVWGLGGDGWAYDIGFGGLDHVLASGANVNLLVLDTEVYSNTGGQMSKATPLGAIAKFASGGRPRPKKDLAAHAMAYEDVYVAQIAFGAKDTQTVNAILEAERYPGTSLIIAYAPCIAQGIDLVDNLHQQKLAVSSGHWPLLRYHPERRQQGQNPLKVDYRRPVIPIGSYMDTEARFSVLNRTHPDAAEQFLKQAQALALHRYDHLTALSTLSEESSPDLEADHD